MTSRIMVNGRVEFSTNRFDTYLPSYIRRDNDVRKPMDNIHVHKLLSEAHTMTREESAQLHRSFAESAWEYAIEQGVVAHGESCSCRSCNSKQAKAIPKNFNPRTPFRDGLPFRDSHEDLVYRVLDNLSPADGWASSEFWQDRYSIDHRDVIRLAQQGFMDAAVAKFSELRRYRVRDERFVKESATFKRIVESARKRRTNLLVKTAAGTTTVRRK